MAGDFKASQVQTNKVIVTGSFANQTTNQLLVYNYSAQSSVLPNNGVIDGAKFNTSTGIGTDVFLFVSGGINKKDAPLSNAVSVFGGDVHISGNLTVAGSSPGGGGGGGTGVNYFWSPSNPFIEASGSLYLSGALHASSLSSSNGAEITGSTSVRGTLNVGTVSNNTVLNYSFANGDGVKASGNYSHAEGYYATGSGHYSHAEGSYTTAGGNYSHAEGIYTFAIGEGSHSEGIGTIASGSNQHVIGKYNKRDNNFSLFVIGDGTGDNDVDRGDIVRVNSGPTIGTGRVEVTGSVVATFGLSGSLTRLSDGSSYLIAGPNINIHTNSLGQVEITGSAAGSSFFRMEVVDYTSVNSTFSTSVGQVIFPANEFSGSLTLRGVIANSNALATGSIQLFNLTSGTYVHIGGPGITHIYTTGTVPTIVTSVNLYGATNFNTTSQSVYELQASSSNGLYTTFLGGFELRPSGSFNGLTYSTSSYYYTYTSGTWEDGVDRLATTASVAIAGGLGPHYFADAIGTDSFFFVSGVMGGKGGLVPGVSVFGGDVVISGTLHGGSPLKIGSPAQFFDSVSAYLAFSQGNDVSATGDYSHAQGQYSSAQALGSHAEGGTTTASGMFAHAEGSQNTASGEASHAEGISTTSSATGSHAEGQTTVASGDYSHAEGTTNTASGYAAHAEGGGTTAVGSVSHAEGADTVSFGNKSHAEGDHTLSYGLGSHAEGYYATGSGNYSHAEGSYTTAGGNYSHAEGIFTFALGEGSHSEGIGTIASGSNQHVLGKYNKRDNNFSLFVIGDGTGDIDSDRGDIVRVNSGASIGTGRVEVTGSLVVSGSNSRLGQLGGFRTYPKVITSLPYTASIGDYIIAVSASAQPGLGIRLPAGVDHGTVFIVKDVSGSASANNIQVHAESAQIDGFNLHEISIDYGSAQFVYFGASVGWGVI